jgi:hypothetical protein
MFLSYFLSFLQVLGKSYSIGPSDTEVSVTENKQALEEVKLIVCIVYIT